MTFLRCLITLVEWEEATVSEEGGSEGRSREGVSLAASVFVQ